MILYLLELPACEAYPVVEDDQVLAVGDQLVGVVVMEGEVSLVRVVWSQRDLTQRTIRVRRPVPHTHYLCALHGAYIIIITQL